MMDNNIFNASGYKDTTAYEAMKNIRCEERKKLIEELKEIAYKHGFIITNKIILKDIKDEN